MINDFTKKEAPVLSTLGLGGGNAARLLLSSGGGGAGAIEDNRSLRFHKTGPLNGTQAGHLKGFTPSSAGNRRTWTWAAWVKVVKFNDTLLLFSSGDGPFDVDHIKFNGDKIEVLSAISQINWRYQTTALHRDPSSWYHITVAVDTTNSTASDRVKIYVNGTRVEDFGVSTAPSQNYENNTSNTKQHAIGYDVGNIGYTYGGYMADVYFIDGSALTPVDNFIELDSNGVYQRKDYTGSFGTNGFHLLDFANESTVGHDSSGNNNDFTANNISSSGTDTDVLLDYPKNGDSNNNSGAGGQVNGNYAVMNPMDSQSSLTLSNGNLDVSNTANSLRNSRATIAYPATGKWYYEYTPGGSANRADSCRGQCGT